MKTKAVRLYGANDLRLEDFDLPEIKDNEVLINVVTDTICASTYKAVIQGKNHKRVPDDVDKNPVIVGHEICGTIVKVGKNRENEWKVGDKCVVQPALKLENGHDPGYSYPFIGGNSLYAVVPEIVFERGCLVHYNGDSFFEGSLVESLGCILRGFKGLYHTDYTTYERFDGAKLNGKIAILGGAGPMGLGTIEMALGYANVKEIVVTDINEDRLQYAMSKITSEYALKRGVVLKYVNTLNIENPEEYLKDISSGGFDDVFVMVPSPILFTMAERIAREDGCINFFAGPKEHNVDGSLNLYRIHYDGIHVVGTAGSIAEDTIDTIKLIEEKKINGGPLVSHILGLKDVIPQIFALEKPNGAKKVCYNNLDIPYIQIDELSKYKDLDPMYGVLDEIVKRNGGLWCSEAEEYLLAHAKRIN